MKKVSIILALFIFCLLPINAQIKVKSTGYVGIGTNNPSTYLEVLGNSSKFSFINTGSNDAGPVILDRYMSDPRFYPTVNHKGYLGQTSNFWAVAYSDRFFYVYGCTQYSDQKFKKNIISLTKSLDKVLLLSGVKYDLDYSSIGSKKEDDEKFGKNQLGLIAQDVQKIVPEVVSSDSNGLGVDYIKLIPLLIEAIKEQNVKIVALENAAKNQNKNAKEVLSSELSTASLSQNVPNPFNENTTIGYYLPTTVISAVFYIYDLQGKQIKSISISERENSSVTIHASELQPGMYYYSIIADGNVIGTEKMILTE